jgi:hypothetical protein
MEKERLGPPKKRSLRDQENVCAFCLFFQRYPAPSRYLRGNCTYYKEWIENAYLTTCSDMSNCALNEKGIYRLVESGLNGGLVHIRRDKKLRTRLFLVK